MDYSLKTEAIRGLFDKVRYYIIPSESNGYKSKFLQSNTLLYCVVFLLILRIGTILISINIPQNIFFANITGFSLENFANQTRQSLGLTPLTVNEKLNQAAKLKAENMVQNNYFDHTSPTGITPWFWFRQVGYSYKYAGENLAIGFFESEDVYKAWLNSPSHRANIVNPNYTEIGTAVLTRFDGNNTIVVVQVFGAQLPVKQVTIKTTEETIVPPATKINSITKTTGQSSIVNSGEVLSQTTISPSFTELKEKSGNNNLFSRLINSILYNYNEWIQNIIYGVSSVVIGVLLILIFSSSNFEFKKQFIFRVVLVVILLSLATALNDKFVISLIPHQIII